MKLNSKILAVIIVVILFGGITFTTLMGWWATETSKVPAKYTEGEAAGEYNPADIRGSYTFGDVSTVFNIPIEDLAAAFNLPAAPDPAGVALKTLEDIYGDLPTEIGTASVRLFTAWYLGLPYQPEDTDYLPLSAADILRQNAIADITVLQMEVPCCSGASRIAAMAVAASGKNVPVTRVVVGRQGEIVSMGPVTAKGTGPEALFIQPS
jgi:hypothetical protein